MDELKKVLTAIETLLERYITIIERLLRPAGLFQLQGGISTAIKIAIVIEMGMIPIVLPILLTDIVQWLRPLVGFSAASVDVISSILLAPVAVILVPFTTIWVIFVLMRYLGDELRAIARKSDLAASHLVEQTLGKYADWGREKGKIAMFFVAVMFWFILTLPLLGLFILIAWSCSFFLDIRIAGVLAFMTTSITSYVINEKSLVTILREQYEREQEAEAKDRLN